MHGNLLPLFRPPQGQIFPERSFFRKNAKIQRRQIRFGRPRSAGERIPSIFVFGPRAVRFFFFLIRKPRAFCRKKISWGVRLFWLPIFEKKKLELPKTNTLFGPPWLLLAPSFPFCFPKEKTKNASRLSAGVRGGVFIRPPQARRPLRTKVNGRETFFPFFGPSLAEWGLS